MNAMKIPMGRDKKIALVAHDNMKRYLLEWATFKRDLLVHHVVYATGTTGSIYVSRRVASGSAAEYSGAEPAPRNRPAD